MLPNLIQKAKSIWSISASLVLPLSQPVLRSQSLPVLPFATGRSSTPLIYFNVTGPSSISINQPPTNEQDDDLFGETHVSEQDQCHEEQETEIPRRRFQRRSSSKGIRQQNDLASEVTTGHDSVCLLTEAAAARRPCVEFQTLPLPDTAPTCDESNWELPEERPRKAPNSHTQAQALVRLIGALMSSGHISSEVILATTPAEDKPQPSTSDGASTTSLVRRSAMRRTTRSNTSSPRIAGSIAHGSYSASPASTAPSSPSFSPAPSSPSSPSSPSALFQASAVSARRPRNAPHPSYITRPAYTEYRSPVGQLPASRLYQFF